MAWIVLDLDETLVQKQMDPATETEVSSLVDGAVEAMHQLASEGHRLTVHTSRFAPMPAERRRQMKEEIEAELTGLGFPPMEVWTGSSKPDADVFVGSKNIAFEGDWGLALAHTQSVLEARGLVEIPQDDGLMPEDPVEQEVPMPEEMP
ncbi:MAG: hypothetical protein E6R04_09155 [Spirochaetes bacterium]|jgi:hypothetical protein|nr:MAG: hypothetical protein E6R04_09155 [Spirochaetota bacterium]